MNKITCIMLSEYLNTFQITFMRKNKSLNTYSISKSKGDRYFLIERLANKSADMKTYNARYITWYWYA